MTPAEWEAVIRQAIVESGSPGSAEFILGLERGRDRRELVEEHFNTFKAGCPEQPCPGGVPRTRNPTTADNRRKLRVQQYRNLQRSYLKCRSAAVKSVLAGTWDKAPADIPFEEMTAFWRPLFERKSIEDGRNPELTRQPVLELLEPYSSSEVQDALKNSQATAAAGPDGRTLKDVKGVPIADLVTCFYIYTDTADANGRAAR